MQLESFTHALSEFLGGIENVKIYKFIYTLFYFV